MASRDPDAPAPHFPSCTITKHNVVRHFDERRRHSPCQATVNRLRVAGCSEAYAALFDRMERLRLAKLAALPSGALLSDLVRDGELRLFFRRWYRVVLGIPRAVHALWLPKSARVLFFCQYDAGAEARLGPFARPPRVVWRPEFVQCKDHGR